MEALKHALVLTGDVQPGFAAADVWPALATYFRMEPERLRSELLARVPISIKESEDLGKLQALQAGAAAVGAVTELHALGADGSLFVLVENTPRGPVPTSFVEERVRRGTWAPSVQVAAVGSSAWRAFLATTPVLTKAPVDQATVAFSAVSADAAQATRAVSDLRAAAPVAAAPVASAPVAAGEQLPPGLDVHAGFWRRFAAYSLDSLILGIPILIVFGTLSYMSFRAALSGEAPGGTIVLVTFLAYVAAIVGSWLYFAKFESGASQATPGKRMMGLKVTNDRGERIRFGRASGRFFGKLVTGLIPFGIGWMLAGWTGRKQAIHDMMASTCVVFREVVPGRAPPPRPPMPWYGWVLNVLPFVFAGIGMAAYFWFMAAMLGGIGLQQSMSDGVDMNEITQQATTLSQGSDPEAEKLLVRGGLEGIAAEVEAVKAEVAQAIAGGGDCPSEERPSTNAWVESIQTGGVAPNCSVTVRLSSSSDIPFAARIERIEWNWDGNAWGCASSMDASYIPWPCN
ncbi:MAG: RDD family protein [Xanthomonadales bacterium]|nr:RDD family protein [Xanthomonadales bacterium]